MLRTQNICMASLVVAVLFIVFTHLRFETESTSWQYSGPTHHTVADVVLAEDPRTGGSFSHKEGGDSLPYLVTDPQVEIPAETESHDTETPVPQPAPPTEIESQRTKVSDTVSDTPVETTSTSSTISTTTDLPQTSSTSVIAASVESSSKTPTPSPTPRPKTDLENRFVEARKAEKAAEATVAVKKIVAENAQAKADESAKLVDALQSLETKKAAKAAKAKAEQEKARQEQAAKEQAEQEKAIQELAAKEKAMQEQAAKDKAAEEKAIQALAAKEKAFQESAAQEQATNNQEIGFKASQNQEEQKSNDRPPNPEARTKRHLSLRDVEKTDTRATTAELDELRVEYETARGEAGNAGQDLKDAEKARDTAKTVRETLEVKVRIESEHTEMDNALIQDLPGLPWFKSSKAAVIVEDRILPNLIPLLLHFSTVLGPEWPVIWLTGPDWDKYKSAPFARAIKSGRIIVKEIPRELKFSHRDAVSMFLVKEWLWRHLAPAEHILLFQADSIVCSKSSKTLEDFTKFDLIGAPIAEKFGRGYNGGLSLRNRQRMLDLIDKYDYRAEQYAMADEHRYVNAPFEDQWFYARLVDMKEADKDGTSGVMLPTEDEAKWFAVETVDHKTPLGYHQPERWQNHNRAQLEEWCPEVRMVFGIGAIAN